MEHVQAVYNYWTGLPEWTTEMDYWTERFSKLKIIFMAYNLIFLLVHAFYRSFLTWPPTSLATSCLF